MIDMVEQTKSAWPHDGWEVWSALNTDLWAVDRDAAVSMACALIANYMVKNDITIREGRVLWRGRPYPL